MGGMLSEGPSLEEVGCRRGGIIGAVGGGEQNDAC